MSLYNALNRSEQRQSFDPYLHDEAQVPVTDEVAWRYPPDKPTLVVPPRLPFRRYSSAWWSHQWDIQVLKGFLPRILYVAFGFSIMASWIIIIFYFAGSEMKHQQANLKPNLSQFKNNNINDSDAIWLIGTLRQFDVDAMSLTVQWAAIYLDDDDTGANTPVRDNPVGFYRDLEAIPDFSLYPDSIYGYYSVDNQSAPMLATLGWHDWDSVDTDIDMLATDSDDIWRTPLFGYPWDYWTGSIVIVLNNLTEAGYLNRSGVMAFAPVGAILEGDILNWKIQLDDHISDSCIDDTPYQNSTCSLTVNFSATRPGIVKFVSIIVVIVNWLSTVAIFLVTGEVVFLRRYYVLSDTDILGVLFAALFALPSVRSLLPGAPSDFGAVIDFIGILPNVVIISLCTMVFAGAKLSARISETMSNA